MNGSGEQASGYNPTRQKGEGEQNKYPVQNQAFVKTGDLDFRVRKTNRKKVTRVRLDAFDGVHGNVELFRMHQI